MRFDPYLEWLKIPAARRPLDFYLLLGIPRHETDAECIREAAATRWELIKTHVSGPHGEQAKRILKELSQAAACLTDPEKRKAYHRQLTTRRPVAESAAPRSRPTLDESKHREKRPRFGPQWMLAPLRVIDDRLRALAGEGNPALHHVLRGLAVFAVIVVGIGLIFLITPGRSDRESADGTTTQETPLPAKKAPAIDPEKLEDLYEAWRILYAEQEKNNTWPVELGDEFQTAMNTLSPEDEIPLKYRELYQALILRHFPRLYELGDIRLRAERDENGKIKRDADGNPLKTDPFVKVARTAEGYGGDGGMGRTRPASIPREDALVGKVDWNVADPTRIRAGLSWRTSPTTTQVRCAQEDLWSYEALLRIIRETNAGATSHYNAAVKRIDALEIGQRAASAFAQPGGGALHAGGSMGSYESDYGDMGVSGPGGPMSGSFAPSGASPGEQLKQQLTHGRYVDHNGMPLAAAAPVPFAEFKMMPVRMLLVVDQRRISKLLVNCVNSSTPLEIHRVTLNPANAGTLDVEPVSSGMGSGGRESDMSSGQYGLGEMPGLGMGRGGRGSDMSSGLGGYGGEAYGGAGSTARPGAGGQESYDLPIEIQGIVYIFNPPDREKLGTGSAPGGIDTVGERMLGTADRRVRWLQLLRLVNACLPKDDQAERPEDIMLRNELHVTSLQCQRTEKLEDWFASLQSHNWYQAPSQEEDDQSGSAGSDASATQDTKRTGPKGPGWVLQLAGYHYHNHHTAGSSQGPQFVRDTLIRSLHTEKIPLPVPGEPSATAEVSAARLGIGYPSLIDPGQVAEVPRPSPKTGETEGVVPKLRRFDFRVQFCWQPTPLSKRDRQSRKALRYAELAKAINTPIGEQYYVNSTLWDPPLFVALRQRGEPPLYAVRDLRGTAGRGAVVMTERGSAQGHRWLVLTGLLPIAQQMQAYTEAFHDARSWNPAKDVPMYVGYQVERAEVNGGGEADQLPWKPIDLKRAFAVQKSFRVAAREVVHYKYFPRQPTRAIPMVFPLPPLMNARWGPEVAHPPGIPLSSDVPESERWSEGAYGREFPDPEAGNYEKGDLEALRRLLEGGGPGGPGSSASRYAGGGMPYGGGMETGMPGHPGFAAPVGEQVELQLFRFFDFSVEPGKRYRYRVQLLVANPNFRVEARCLETEDLAKQPWVETEWSDPSEVIGVPRDSMLLLGPVKPPRKIDDEPVATVMARTFRIENGLETADLFQVVRGQLANFQRKPVEGDKAPTVKQRRDKRRADRTRASRRSRDGSDEYYGGAEEYSEDAMMFGMEGMDMESSSRPTPDKKTETEQVSHHTDMLVLDMYGGTSLRQNDPAITAPAAMLLLDPDGNLLIRDELDDLQEYERYRPVEGAVRP